MTEDFSGDDDFDAGDADSALCHPCPVGDIKKGGHIAIKGLSAIFLFFCLCIVYGYGYC